ncbi:MAG: cytochrome c biogenesis protein CcdA, partial [Actinobacteria bacterium]|nr:cytochrome c biogenesis protein CcdA [Actinomycetota bacterium]
TKIGGGLLILIGLLQVSNLWDQLMNSLRDLISGFIPLI